MTGDSCLVQEYWGEKVGLQPIKEKFTKRESRPGGDQRDNLKVSAPGTEDLVRETIGNRMRENSTRC